MPNEQRLIRFLTVDEVIALHQTGIELYGGSLGLRDAGLLESAVKAPQQTFDGEFLLPDIFAMAASLLHGICNNHAFLDGNKRVSLRAADVFLSINGFDLQLSDDDAYDMTMNVAKGELGREELAEIIMKHCVPMQ